ncbi:MAG: efflux RND transporter periplasmic adaptor subunit [Paracoccaceae bacterium]
MRQTTTLLSGAALGALALGGILYGAERFDLATLGLPALVAPAEAAAPADGSAPPAPVVDVVAAEAHAIDRFDAFTGRFEAADEIAVRARVEGRLDAVHFRPGQIVERGDLLFTLDARPFEAALAEAEARVAEARAARRLAEAELTRQQRLRDGGHVSEAVLDEAVQAAEAAGAAIAAAEAAAHRARLDLDFTRIHAPVTGRISDDAVSPGNLIAAGAAGAVLTTIVSLDPIHFVFDATERQYLDYLRATEGTDLRERAGTTPVAVRLIDEPDFAHEGAIDFVDNRLDRATGTIRGRAVLANPDGLLTPGMFGRLRLVTAEAAETVLIPEHAVVSDGPGKAVWVVADDGTVTRRAVALGERAEGLRIVETGLAAGERVAVSALHALGQGARVDAREPRTRVAAR